MKMTTKEMEQAFGISRKTLFFYEEEGLLHPERKENGYREYRDEDIGRLKEILLLRNMDISLGEVKKYLNKEITGKELLEEQSKQLHKKKEAYEKKEQEALYLKEREMPLLDYGDLLDVNCARGRRIALCSRKRKKDYIRKIRNLLIISAILIYLFLSNYRNSIMSFLPLYVYLLLPFIMILIYCLNAIHQGSFLEFTDDGVWFYRGGKLWDDFKHCVAVLRGYEEDDVIFAPYKDIEEVEVHVKKEYIKYWSLYASEIYTYSIRFRFYNSDSFYLENPYTMENDQALFAFVLLAKVDNINDPDDVLPAMVKGTYLTEEMKKRVA